MKTRLFLIVACLSCVIGCHAKGGEDGASVSFVHADVRDLFSDSDRSQPDTSIFSKSRVIFFETAERALWATSVRCSSSKTGSPFMMIGVGKYAYSIR